MKTFSCWREKSIVSSQQLSTGLEDKMYPDTEQTFKEMELLIEKGTNLEERSIKNILQEFQLKKKKVIRELKRRPNYNLKVSQESLKRKDLFRHILIIFLNCKIKKNILHFQAESLTRSTYSVCSCVKEEKGDVGGGGGKRKDEKSRDRQQRERKEVILLAWSSVQTKYSAFICSPLLTNPLSQVLF